MNNKKDKISAANDKTGRYKNKNITATLIVICLTAIVLLAAYIRISKITEKRCLDRMQEAVNTVMDDIGSKLTLDSTILHAVADMISTEDSFDPATMQNIMNKFSSLTLAKNINLLLPGDILISQSGNELDVSGQISFEDEAALGEHVTDRMHSVGKNKEELLIRHFVPIVKNGSTVAMLYTSTNLEGLPGTLNIDNIYNGKASFFLIDRNTGDFLMDTLHNSLGSLYDLKDSATKGSVSFADATDRLMRGKTGHVQFLSNTDGEYMFFYYAPITGELDSIDTSIYNNKWAVAVSVPDSEAFANLYRIRKVYCIFAAIEALFLVLYLLWTIKNTEATLEKAVLQERLVKAENAERAKTMFLSNMSHDIRTPMNAIIGYTTLAATNIDNKVRVKDYLAKILSSSNHLLSLINDILDMSRIESGRVFIEETACSLPDILRDLHNILQSQMKSKQLNFFMDTIDVIDEDIYCDKLHLNQVLLNLLSNSIKFTPPGGSVSLMIKQKHGAPEGYASYEIRIKDTGIGMSEEFIDKIFEPFERESTSTVSGIQGTGLGMAIAKSIVDMMGGTLEVHSQPNKGTEFVMSVEFRLQSERKQIEIIKSLEGLHALVVDDDYNVCDSVTKMLVQLGMRANWTMSGNEAVLHAKQALELGDTFSAYIIDWQLPDLNGIEVTRRIRKAVGDDIPIIILTAYDLSSIEEEAKSAGVTAFCSKPIFLSTLKDTLLTAIGELMPETTDLHMPHLDCDLSSKRILLVEDNELNREIAEVILTENGLNVDTAEDGTVALDMIRNAEDGYYDLILMDIQMPIMNGYDATKAIRALDSPLSSIPIIAMTANAFNEDKKLAIESGMNDHIAKPLDMEKLFKVLHKYLCNN